MTEEVAEQDFNRLEGDNALAKRSQDELGRVGFAEGLAKRIIEIESPDGIVVAVDGTWGSGKSTILNFIKDWIDESGDEKIVTVDFNPWLYARRAELAQALLTEIAAALDLESPLGQKARKMIGRLASFAQVVPSNLIFDVSGSAKKLEELTADSRSLSALKNDFAEAMEESGKTIVVFVDDIDRLEPMEISDLFSALKVLGDFPNTLYVLALDADHVARQLEAASSTVDGAAYIEKLIQVSFPVPLPQAAHLQKLLSERLNVVLGESKKHLRDEEEWKLANEHILSVLIDKPRDLIRVTNALRVTYPAVKDQVNVVDFVLFETLRVLLPDAYRLVLQNLRLFGLPADAVSYYVANQENEGVSMVQLVDAIRETAGNRDRQDAVARLIETLFPQFKDAASQMVTDRKGSARAHRRIADPDTFRIILWQQLPDSIVPTAEWEALLAAVTSVDELAAWVTKQRDSDQGLGRATNIFVEAKLHARSIPEHQRVAAAANALGCIEFDLLSDEFEGLQYEIVAFGQELIQSLEPGFRPTATKLAVGASKNSRLAIAFLSRVEDDSGLVDSASARDIPMEDRNRHSFGIVPVSCLIELEELVVKRIKHDAASVDVLDMASPLYVMRRWDIWAADGSFREWADSVRADNARLKKLLAVARSMDPETRDFRTRVRPNRLQARFDLAQLKVDVLRLQREDDSQLSKELAMEFLIELSAADQPSTRGPF